MPATPTEATIANADLWTRYFQNEWARWLALFGGPDAAPVTQMVEGAAARVASFLTLVAAGPIAQMYSANAPLVSAQTRPGEPVPIRTPEAPRQADSAA